MDDEPKRYSGIMVSSTFTDLKAHRREVIEAIHGLGFKANVMEHDGARADADVIQSSLGFVRDSAAYIGVISQKYGQTPFDAARNPDRLSITELEFNEARRLGRPILLFIMSDDHPLTKADVEQDPEKLVKLNSFREQAKRIDDESEAARIYETFSSKDDLAKKAAIAIGRLLKFLDNRDAMAAGGAGSTWPEEVERPRAPELRAMPRYLGSHDFIGRESELQALDVWASEADPNPFLLFEAIGGSGKSILTWHWVNRRALDVRPDWAGRFWYSFYERGATMGGFCREALSYMCGRAASDFARMRLAELGDRLIAELDRQPWLLILDGLERVLVQYHRLDAAQIRDDEVDIGSDPVANRDPCRSIVPEDDDLLRRLAAVQRAKVLATSRLMPAALISPTGNSVPGVLRVPLRGLSPYDAEKLFLACGARGESKPIQNFLQVNCDCHPLVIGALAGLVNDYFPDRGNFDAWMNDPAHGLALNLGELDLVQRRNHILDAAITALEPEGRQLLETLALLIGGADYRMLEAFNPHQPRKLEEVKRPEDPEQEAMWEYLDAAGRAQARDSYRENLAAHEHYRESLESWRNAGVKTASRELSATIRDLERRGLLQYDLVTRRFDLHPVVRGVAAGRMGQREQEVRGEEVINYYTARSPDDWDEVDSLEEVAPGLQIVATLTRIGRFDDAMRVYRGSLSNALFFNLESDAESLALVKGFFPGGWQAGPSVSRVGDQSYLLNDAALLVSSIDPGLRDTLISRKIEINIKDNDVSSLSTTLRNSAEYTDLKQSYDLVLFSLELSRFSGISTSVFVSLLKLFSLTSITGNLDEADRHWSELDAMTRPFNSATYRLGDAELDYAWDRYRRGQLTEELLTTAERLAQGGHNRGTIRDLARLRGLWHLDRGEPAAAAENLSNALVMARAVNREDVNSEAALALARLQCGDEQGARSEAQRLKHAQGWAAHYVALVWRALGEHGEAVLAALRSHDLAVGSGEPYVYRFELDRARALLAELDVDLPPVPEHDPAAVKPYPWQADVRDLIARLKAERGPEDAG